ncbi:trichohyalin-like isoform X5 [Pomacea canaliculata]|uniref:trichohyalin-like isoform X5 n=1 Tax=Pomacea canaliculata TaxID=400727 RepID=UPI000D72830A|nr:trichohyalin-like isoform X5 [Pomacea canaliculata]
MTAAVDTDIDAFIREQKLKLASERQTLHKDSHETSHHQQRVLTPVQDVGLPVGQYQKKRLALDQERRKEYQEYLRQKQVTDKGADNSDNQSSLDLKAVSSELTQKNNNKQIHSGGYEGLTLGGYEKVKARLREERRQDFLNMLASKLERQYQRNTLENLKKQERELREELDKNEHYPGVKSRPDSDLLYRQEWAKKHTEAQRPNHPAADVSPLRSMGRSDSDQSRENYKQHWQEVHGNTQSNGFNLSAAEVTPRKTKGKLDGGISSPDYRHRWQEVHGNKQSSEKHTRRKWDAPVAPFNGSVLLRDVDADQQKSKQPRRPVNSTSVESQREGTHTQQEASKEMSGLPLGEYEEKRKTYDAQRRQEYSEMREGQERRQREELDNTFGLMGLGVHRQPHPSRRQNDVQGASDQWQTSGTRKGRPDSITGSRAQIDSIGDLLRWDLGPGRVGLTSADLVNQALREERRREYSLQLEQEDQKRRKKMQQREAQHRQDTSFQEGDRQEKWSEEREQEYRRMLTGKSKQEKQQEEEAVQQAGSVTQNHAMDVSRKPFQAAEGRQEFSTTPQSQQNCGFAKERHSGTPSSEGSFLSHLGSRYENERRRLREERQNEYKAMLQEKAVLRREPVDQGIVSEKVGGSAIRPNSSALRERQREERNREYNTMLDQKRKQNDDQKYGSIFKENFEDNFLSSLGSRDVHRK